MSKRLVYAQAQQKRVVDEFEQRYAHYVFGQPHLDTEDARREYAQKTGDGSDAERIKRGWDTTTFPLHHMLRSVMMPYLMARDPVWINRERKGSDAMERARVDVYSDLERNIWGESEATREVQRALEDAFCYRMGWVNTSWDGAVNLPVHRWVDARNMLIDCETQSPRMIDRRWVAEKVILPIDTARWYAKEVWDAGKYSFEPVKYESIDDENEPRSRQGRHGYMKEGGDEDAPTKFVRLVMVQVKGANPWTMSSNLDARNANDKAGKDTVYDGEDHILILEARAGYTMADSYKVVGRIDWPFPCKRGRFTYTPFVLTRDNRSVYPVSIMQPGHSSQVAADVALQAYNTDSRNSARRWVGYNPEAFQNREDAERIVGGDEALMTVPLKNNADPRIAIATGNFGSPNQHLNMTFAMNRENYEAVEGMNKFDVQVRANQTAANTMIQNESAQIKVDDISQLVERAVVELGEKGVACARANMTYEAVSEWIHIPKEVDGTQVEKELPTKNGDGVVISELWDDDPDWADVRREVEVHLEPRSIRFTNPEKEAQNIQALQQFQTETARIIGDTVGKGGVGAAQEIARTANETMRAIAQLQNIANYERFLFDWTKITPPEPPPVSGDGMLQAQMQNAQIQGELNAQQQAAFTRMQQQGVNPEGFPAAAQGGG